MKTLHCTACSSTAVQKNTLGEYECTYCGTKMLPGELDGPAPGPVRSDAGAPPRKRRWRTLIAGSVTLLLGVLLYILVGKTPPENDAFLTAIPAKHADGRSVSPTQSGLRTTNSSGQEFGSEAITAPPTVSAALSKFKPLHDSIGNIYFIGMIHNTGESVLDHARVDITLFDAAGKKLAAAHGYAPQSCLGPGEEGPVQILAQNPPAYHHFEARIEPRAAQFAPPRQTFTFQDAKLSPARYQGYQLKGQIKHEGSRAATYVQIIALLLDDAGTPVGMDTAFLSQQTFRPADTTPFDISISLVQGNPTHFRLFYDHLLEQKP